MALRTVNAQAAQNIQKRPKSLLWEVMAMLNQSQADLAALHVSFLALTAKMDADFADVTNASIDYASSVDPAAQTMDTITTRELGVPD